MKIYDCFTFYNELDLLDLRLQLLDHCVDYFVIVEATKTFQNNSKPLYYQDNLERYAKYSKKIIHVVVDDMPGGNPWNNERHQRDSIMRGLVDADPDDICIISDADEILRPEVIDHMRENPKDIIAFRTPYFNFKLNYMLINNQESYCVWIVACRRKMLTYPDAFRGTRFQLNTLPWGYEDDDLRMYEHAGWHFTYLGDTEFIKNKIRSFSHAELNNSDVLDNIDVEAMMKQGVGFNPQDPKTFVPVKLDNYFPQTLLENQDCYAHYLIDAENSATIYLPQEGN